MHTGIGSRPTNSNQLYTFMALVHYIARLAKSIFSYYLAYSQLYKITVDTIVKIVSTIQAHCHSDVLLIAKTKTGMSIG